MDTHIRPDASLQDSPPEPNTRGLAAEGHLCESELSYKRALCMNPGSIDPDEHIALNIYSQVANACREALIHTQSFPELVRSERLANRATFCEHYMNQIHDIASVASVEVRALGRSTSTPRVALSIQGHTFMEVTENVLRSVFAKMSDVYFRTDKEGRFVVVSPSVKDLLGYSVEELLGKPSVELYIEPDARQIVGLEKKFSPAEPCEIALRAKNGSATWVLVRWNTYYDASGEICGIEGFVRDVAEKRGALDRLRESEQRLRTIFEHLVDVYYRTDNSGKLLMISPSVERLLGYKPNDLIGNQLADLYVDPSVRERFMAELKARAGTFYGFENKLRRKDGIEIWAIASSQFYYDESEKIAGVEGIVKDITPRRLAEGKLQRYSRQLQETVSDLETICYSVAHDLRTPLRAIDGYAQILNEDCATCPDKRATRPVELINRSINRMATLIDDVLHFARSGHGHMNVGDVNLRELAREIVEECASVELEITIGDLPTVAGDRGLLRSVLSNLMQNAIKFTKGRASPFIELGVHEVGLEEVVCFVRDNGVGFDQRYADRIFCLFERVHDHVPEFCGTGVGLAVVKRIIQRHGGRVWVEAAEGMGACFYFSLPTSACALHPDRGTG